MNGLICILDMLKIVINPKILKDEELEESAEKYINSTIKMLEEVRRNA